MRIKARVGQENPEKETRGDKVRKEKGLRMEAGDKARCIFTLSIDSRSVCVSVSVDVTARYVNFTRVGTQLPIWVQDLSYILRAKSKQEGWYGPCTIHPRETEAAWTAWSRFTQMESGNPILLTSSNQQRLNLEARKKKCSWILHFHRMYPIYSWRKTPFVCCESPN